MTAPTPEQMRALAEDVLERVAADRDGDLDFADRIMTALRTAADQLEAVQELHRWLRKNIGSPALHARLDQFTADTAPQGDRDE